MMYITTTCPFCQTATEIPIKEEDYHAWRNGELAQKAFPYLTPERREQLISGICPVCWDEMFCETFDDDDEEEVEIIEVDDDFLGELDEFF